MKHVTKAIIPVAGWGTRMLPITKSIEKSMLPVMGRPVIDYIVQDVRKAGITDIFFVVNREDSQLEQYYSVNHELNGYLVRNGKSDKLPLITPPDDTSFTFIVQSNDGRYGTSVPVGLTAGFIADDELALVIMGDQFWYREDGGSNAADLIALTRETQAHAGLLGTPVSAEEVSKYGIIERNQQDMYQRIVEKPLPEDAPGNLINASFYLLPTQVFALARDLPANKARGEYELTDALNAYVAKGNDIVVGETTGKYLDCGSPGGWLHANNVIAQET